MTYSTANRVHRIFNMLVAMVATFLLTSCASSSPLRTSQARSRIQQLELGMTKADVINFVGKPYSREVFMGKDGVPLEYLFYHTQFTGNATFIEPDDRHLTPVVLRDGKVYGWGRNFFVEKKQIEIEQNITIKDDTVP